MDILRFCSQKIERKLSSSTKNRTRMVEGQVEPNTSKRIRKSSRPGKLEIESVYLTVTHSLLTLGLTKLSNLYEYPSLTWHKAPLEETYALPTFYELPTG